MQVPTVDKAALVRSVAGGLALLVALLVASLPKPLAASALVVAGVVVSTTALRVRALAATVLLAVVVS
jgi:hypothetical protein